jgi:hypothetical protein
LFFGLHHICKWARALSRLESIAARATSNAEPPARVPFTVTSTLREAWDVYRRSWIRLVVSTLGASVVSAVSLGLLAGPAHAGLYAGIYAALAHPDQRFGGGRFTVSLSRPVTTCLCALLTGGLVLVGAPLVLPPVLLLFAFPFCALEEQGVFRSVAASCKLALRRPFTNLGIVLSLAAPLVVSTAAWSLWVLVLVAYVPFAHVVVVTAFVRQNHDGRGASGLIVAEDDADATDLKAA